MVEDKQELVFTSFEKEISQNKLKSYGLMAVVLFFLMLIIWLFSEVYSPGSALGVSIFGFLFVLLYMGVTYFYGDSIVLASTGAKPIDERTPKGAYLKSVVENLAFAARLPTPKLYVIESTELNAFATGRDPEHSSIAVTSALLNKLNRTELEGVLAHEMSHISNYDVRFAMLVAVMVGLIAVLSHMFIRMQWFGGGRDRKGGGVAVLVIVGIILAIIAPIVVRLVQSSISRKREFLADASGARLTRYPEGLASALEKISGNKGNMEVSEAVSHLFFADPTHSSLDSVFATHPPIQERIKILRAM